MVFNHKFIVTTFVFSFSIAIGLQISYGRTIEQLPNSILKHGTKVFQTSAMNGFIQSNSTSNAILLASGGPAGIINSGGTTTSFTGSSSVSQDIPKNTSFSIGGSMGANCGGGQLGTFVAGQQHTGIFSIGNCNTFVESKKEPS